MHGVKATDTFNRPASAAFHAVTHVWGREYLDVFLNVCIPNQLAPGNVPALPSGSRYRILTGSIHVEELDAHPMVHALREVIPVDIVVVEAIDRQMGIARGHDLMMACHQRAIADILGANAAIIMLAADVILSEHALASIVRRHGEGYRAVVTTGLRLVKESFLRSVEDSRVPLAAISSRDLVRMAMPHLHPHTQSMFADASPFSKAPVAVYWRVGSDGLLARCLHLHPLMVDPMRPLPLVTGTNDGPYLAQVSSDFSRVHVVTDSDELQVFELTTLEREVCPARGAGVSAWRAAIIAAKCDDLQLHYWQRHPIYIHAGDLNEEWIAAASTAEKFARSVMRRRPYSSLARRWFRVVGDMRKRRARSAKTWRRYRRRVRVERLRTWSERHKNLWERRRPRVRFKQIQRPLRLLFHRAAKASRLRVKRIYRRMRLVLPT